jgi:hypothetical protein
MIPLLLMLADAPAMTAIDAERAFAADAKAIGQWTAFVKWSADDATMFVPQPTNAHKWLKDRKNPAQAIDWWPTASYVSCDGKTAVNTGGWKRPDGTVGYFTTAWQKQADGGWKWVVDSGDTLKVAPERPAEPKVVRASCAPIPLTVCDCLIQLGKVNGQGGSDDHTLEWRWTWSKSLRTFSAQLFDGKDSPAVVSNWSPPLK